MRIVVCDTGPILHLHEAGALELLAKAGEVFVPPAVDRELA
ncbi:MAG: DNA-binding protein, partial [Syntrophobacteraceae bacterium]|nr:DNA-binding protein [Syntrophobacteraceae bacterium]